MRSRTLLAGLLLSAALGGCRNGGSATRPIDAAPFYDGRAPAEAPLSPADQPGPMYPRPDQGPRPAEQVPPPAPRSQAPATQAVANPRPTTTPVGDSTGGYVTVGGVLADVNGAPIYVDKVLAAIDKDLRARAMELDAARFREVAERLISDHEDAMIKNELVYANALRHLNAEEKAMADYATERFRQQKIVEAGGSIELARRKARAEGIDFDEMIQAKAREHVFQFYYERKIGPRVRITAEEMRQYYSQNLDEQFTKLGEARFRLIKVDPKKYGGAAAGRDQALKKAQALRQRAEAGAPFDALAGEYNDDERLQKKGGDVGWVQRGAYRLSKVEDQVFALRVGQVTPIVEDDGAFYVARLEESKAGQVQPFEAAETQQQITVALRSRHLKELWARDEQRLAQDAITRKNPDQLQAAVQMAMQRYALWRGE